VDETKYLHGVNITRFRKIYGPRRRRNPKYRACQMSELKNLPWFSGGLMPQHEDEVLAAIEAPPFEG
jgi:hypothetical protein